MNSTGYTSLTSTKPHMIKLRNNEYEAHHRKLIDMMGSSGAFAVQPQPIIRRTDKYLWFDKQQHRTLLSSRAEDQEGE